MLHGVPGRRRRNLQSRNSLVFRGRSETPQARQHPNSTLNDSDPPTPAEEADDTHGDHDEDDAAGSSKRLVKAAYVDAEAIADRVADPHRVRHEQECANEITDEERAECQAEGPGQRAGEKACAADESRGADRDGTVPP